MQQNDPRQIKLRLPITEELLRKSEDEEFDRTLGGQDTLGKKIAGMGTKNGGLILVGQDDLAKGGTVLGIDENVFQTDLTHALKEVKPTPFTQTEIKESQGKKIAVIQVLDVGQRRPCSYKRVYYERKANSTISLEPEEVRSYHLLYGQTNDEEIPTYAEIADIDEDELKLYSAEVNKGRENVLASVMTKNNHLTIRGTLILTKTPSSFLEGAFVEIQKYENFMGAIPIPIGPPNKISKPARQLIDETTRAIIQNLPLSVSYDGATRMVDSGIPVAIVRETITNAVAHRNYRSNEHIRIRIYADGFDISNPAVITNEKWLEIQRTGTTYHPNEGVYTFLNKALLYEGRGEGIPKIKKELKDLGKTEPEFIVIGNAPSNFFVRISLSPAKTKDVKKQKLEELLGRRKEITTTDVMKHLKTSRVTAIRLLQNLVEQKRLAHSGTTRTSKYSIIKN